MINAYEFSLQPWGLNRFLVLRTELRQREELVSRLVSDVERMKKAAQSKKRDEEKIREKLAQMSADYSANLVLVDEMERSERSLRKDLAKAMVFYDLIK